jgi:hypothetical protein
MKDLVVRLKSTIERFKKWMRKYRKNDDDYFDHPFAIF